MIYLDTETFQPDPARDLKAVGSYRYAETSELLLVPYALDDGPVQLWDLTDNVPMPDDLWEAMLDPQELIVAHNAMFDRTNWNSYGKRSLEVPVVEDIRRWRCLMVKSYTLGLPGALADLCEVMGLPEEQAKMKEGRRLVLLFTKPRPNGKIATRHTHPKDWELFRQYAVQDVVSMRLLWKMLPDWIYRGEVLNWWFLDQQINDRGFLIDTELVKKAREATVKARESLDAELAELTEHCVEAHTNVEDLRQWVTGEGVPMRDLQKGTVAAVLRRKNLPPQVRRALEIRQLAGKTSTAKYYKLDECLCEDGKVHGGIQFYGAMRTGRSAGRLFQVHNLPSRGLANQEAAVNSIMNGTVDIVFDDVLHATSSAIRGVIVAPPGRKLVVSDESQIEARFLPWLANDEDTLDIFREGREVYIETAAEILEKDMDAITDFERTVYGKVPTLALGYQGGVDAFNRMALNYGVEGLEDETVKGIVKKWRFRHPMITSFWKGLQECAFEAIRNPGKAYRCRKLAFKVMEIEGYRWLFMRLPSGRMLSYANPRILPAHTPYGMRPVIHYDGIHQHTKKWTALTIYGGKFAENATQAGAGDILFGAYPRIEAAGYDIVFSVHDEIVTEADDDPRFNAKHLSELLSQGEPWSVGLPLEAKGFEAHRYAKH